MAVTYTLPIVSAVVDKRQVALIVSTLGQNPIQIIDANFDDGDFKSLISQLQQLNWRISGIEEKHLAYPVLHYFHIEDKRSTLTLGLVRLDEALTIIEFAFPDLPQLSRRQLKMTKDVLGVFLNTLGERFLSASQSAPPPPDLSASRALAESPRSLGEITEYVLSRQSRRVLQTYIEEDGWSWKDL